jgi:hypothetical protein
MMSGVAYAMGKPCQSKIAVKVNDYAMALFTPEHCCPSADR